jgi:hypothetical protein
MPQIAVERTIGKTKKAVLGGLIGYNTEKMGKQNYKRLAISLREGEKDRRWHCRRSLDHGAVYPALLDGAEASRQGLRDETDRGDRGRGEKVWGHAVLSGYDEFSGAGFLPRLWL